MLANSIAWVNKVASHRYQMRLSKFLIQKRLYVLYNYFVIFFAIFFAIFRVYFLLYFAKSDLKKNLRCIKGTKGEPRHRDLYIF